MEACLYILIFMGSFAWISKIEPADVALLLKLLFALCELDIQIP